MKKNLNQWTNHKLMPRVDGVMSDDKKKIDFFITLDGKPSEEWTCHLSFRNECALIEEKSILNIINHIIGECNKKKSKILLGGQILYRN